MASNFDSPIPEEQENKVIAGIGKNKFWCIPCTNTANVAELLKKYRAVYTVLETCRKYGNSIVVLPSIGFAALAYTKHPWIDSGNYLEAAISADILLIEGVYPDGTEHSADWKMLQTALSQRTAKTNRPTVLIDDNFKKLPVIALSLAATEVTEVDKGA